MLIAYQDFFPTLVKPGIFADEYERLEETVARANAWILESGVEVINVETVVLPNVGGAADASQTGIRTSGEMSSYWHQFIRVWYRSTG